MLTAASATGPDAHPVTKPADPTRMQLIERHLPLVTFTVNRMTEFLTGVMERDDAIGYGVKGLINAIDNYDPTKGTTLSTYAMVRIRGAIIDAARTMDFLSRGERGRIRNLERANWKLAIELGRWPTVKELSDETGLATNDVKRLRDGRTSRVLSLELAMSSCYVEGTKWQIEDQDESIDPAGEADRRTVLQLLVAAVKSLDERERQRIQMHSRQELPMRIIGARLSISESRVGQIHRRSLSRLRAKLEAQQAA